MLDKAVVVGVGQVNKWGEKYTVENVLNILGGNTGNMMFTESLSRVLHEPTHASFALTDASFEGRDSIVLASANWINEFEDFAWLADRLEKTNLPIFLFGVGAQSGLDHSIPKVKEGTLRLLKLVSERSEVIAARGEFSCEVLAHYGIKNVVPAGCPSLLLSGKVGPVFEREASLDGVVIHGTRHGFHRASAFQNRLYREGLKNDWEMLLQSESADIYFALNKLNNPDITSRAESILLSTYEAEGIAPVADYLKRKGLFFTNYEAWIKHMKTRSFCVGTRIHGTIASILAGTPAILIAHDSRTLELARTMGVAHVLSSSLSDTEALPMEDLMAAYKENKHFPGYPEYFKTYMDVFRRNRLKVSKFI